MVIITKDNLGMLEAKSFINKGVKKYQQQAKITNLGDCGHGIKLISKQK
tara:strand:- start:264 stop:410 length:147 start_codon:yes stop_codon:yes gene_type:complete